MFVALGETGVGNKQQRVADLHTFLSQSADNALPRAMYGNNSSLISAAKARLLQRRSHERRTSADDGFEPCMFAVIELENLVANRKVEAGHLLQLHNVVHLASEGEHVASTQLMLWRDRCSEFTLTLDRNEEDCAKLSEATRGDGRPIEFAAMGHR